MYLHLLNPIGRYSTNARGCLTYLKFRNQTVVGLSLTTAMTLIRSTDMAVICFTFLPFEKKKAISLLIYIKDY